MYDADRTSNKSKEKIYNVVIEMILLMRLNRTDYEHEDHMLFRIQSVKKKRK